MLESDDVLPVIPVLSYANPQAAQPTNGRLLVEYYENGVTITDPKVIATSPALIKGVGAVIMAVGLAFALWLAWAGQINDGDFAAAIVAVVCGAVAAFRRPAQQKPHTVRVASSRIYTSGCPDHDWISGRFLPKRFVMIKTSPDLWTHQHLSMVNVRYSLGMCVSVGFTVFRKISVEEAIWAVDLLNKALEGKTLG